MASSTTANTGRELAGDEMFSFCFRVMAHRSRPVSPSKFHSTSRSFMDAYRINLYRTKKHGERVARESSCSCVSLTSRVGHISRCAKMMSRVYSRRDSHQKCVDLLMVPKSWAALRDAPQCALSTGWPLDFLRKSIFGLVYCRVDVPDRSCVVNLKVVSLDVLWCISFLRRHFNTYTPCFSCVLSW